MQHIEVPRSTERLGAQAVLDAVCEARRRGGVAYIVVSQRVFAAMCEDVGRDLEAAVDPTALRSCGYSLIVVSGPRLDIEVVVT